MRMLTGKDIVEMGIVTEADGSPISPDDFRVGEYGVGLTPYSYTSLTAGIEPEQVGCEEGVGGRVDSSAFTVGPGDLVTVTTRERVKVPAGCVVRFEQWAFYTAMDVPIWANAPCSPAFLDMTKGLVLDEPGRSGVVEMDFLNASGVPAECVLSRNQPVSYVTAVAVADEPKPEGRERRKPVVLGVGAPE